MNASPGNTNTHACHEIGRVECVAQGCEPIADEVFIEAGGCEFCGTVGCPGDECWADEWAIAL